MRCRVIVVCLVNVVPAPHRSWTWPNVILNIVAMPVILSMTGAHILLNMREAAEKGLNQGTSCPEKLTISYISFAEVPDGSVRAAVGSGSERSEIEVVNV